MYIMTHFLKNVLTFLLQYDIYISFCSGYSPRARVAL